MWSSSWPRADVAAISELYADDAIFHSAPFRAQQAPAEYVAWAFADQVACECRFGEPIVEGPRAAIDWWAVVSTRNGSVETIAGTSLLRFAHDGRVVEQRDAWGAETSRRELPGWAATS